MHLYHSFMHIFVYELCIIFHGLSIRNVSVLKPAYAMNGIELAFKYWCTCTIIQYKYIVQCTCKYINLDFGIRIGRYIDSTKHNLRINEMLFGIGATYFSSIYLTNLNYHSIKYLLL